MSVTRKIVFVGALALALVGCKSKKMKSAEEPAHACQSSADCSAGWVCLANVCADAAAGAAFINSSNAVTPAKVGAQVEQVQAAHDDQIDKIAAEAK